MPRIAAIDLSHHNTIPESLVPAKEAGVVGVIHKLTESTGFVDSKCAARQQLARAAGLQFGVYHFLRPGSMSAQVDHFISQAAKLGLIEDPTTLFACDHEDPGVSVESLVEFMQRLELKIGRSPVLYSGHVLREQLSKPEPRLQGYRLWFAAYTTTPKLPAGWNKLWLWQYSDGQSGPQPHSVPGVNAPCDCNDFARSNESLIAEWSGVAPPAPIPEPEPEPEPEPQPEPEPIETIRIDMTILPPSGQLDQAVRVRIDAPAGSSVSFAANE